MSRHIPRPEDAFLTRREMLCRRTGMGFGAMALGGILTEAALGGSATRPATSAIGTSPLAPHPPQFAPKAKRVIHLFMNGGPSARSTPSTPSPQLTK